MVVRYLSLPQIADHLGVTRRTIQEYAATILPTEDGRIGMRRVWLPHTIDLWNSLRPGKNPTAADAGWLERMPERPIVIYLDGPRIAERLDLSPNTISDYRKRNRFPPADATTGTLNGWLAQTVDDWNARRPGKRPGRDAADWHLPPAG